MSWLVLTAGLPDMRFPYLTPGNQWHRDESVSPGPAEFLPVLLEALAGLHVAPAAQIWDEPHGEDAVAWVVEGERADEISWERWGRCGSPAVGFRWESSGLVDDTAAYSQTYTSHNLPATELRWSMTWLKSGYRHRFCHQSLSVRFTSARADAQFHAVWQRVFGQPPVLAAESAPTATL